MSVRFGSLLALFVLFAGATTARAAVIVESKTAANTVTAAPAYSEGTAPGGLNNWQVTTAKSTAAGLTGVGSRFASSTSIGGTATWFQYQPTLPQAGAVYTVEITHTPTSAGTTTLSTITTTNATFSSSIADADAAAGYQTAVFNSSGGNTWELVGKLALNAGISSTGAIRFDETANNNRIYADGIRFTLDAPNKITGPVPSDGTNPTGTQDGPAVDVPVSWTNGTINNFKYDVYLGTTSGALTLVQNDVPFSATPNFTFQDLLPNTQYFWRVDAQNVENGTATGDEYDFTTTAIPEPTSAGLLVLGVAVLARRRHRC
jgi:hypothetical protein